MSATYTEPGRISFPSDYFPDDYLGYQHEDANGPQDFITVEEPRDSVLGQALVAYISREIGLSYWPHTSRLLVTTEGWWSGYSEYTITNTWETVVITAPEHNWERRFASPAELFKALAEVDPVRT